MGSTGAQRVWFILSHGGGRKAQRREAHCLSHTASEPSNGTHDGLEPSNHGLVIMGVGEGRGLSLLANFQWHQVSESGPLWARARWQAGGWRALELRVANLVQEHECHWQFLHLRENREQYEACSRRSKKGGWAGCCVGRTKAPWHPSPARALGGGAPAAHGKGKRGSSMVTGQGEGGPQGLHLRWPW